MKKVWSYVGLSIETHPLVPPSFFLFSWSSEVTGHTQTPYRKSFPLSGSALRPKDLSRGPLDVPLPGPHLIKPFTLWKGLMEVINVIFNIGRPAPIDDMESKSQYVEIKVNVPRYVLERALQEFNNSWSFFLQRRKI